MGKTEALAATERTEQRRDHRQRVLKGASILIDVDSSEMKCQVRNQSPNGAELRILIGQIVPPEFLLWVPVDNCAYKCVVRWRLESRLGVMFVGKEPKPGWVYG
jgi:hypothetical protein